MAKHEYDWQYAGNESSNANMAERYMSHLDEALADSGMKNPNIAKRKVILLDSNPEIERACATAAAVCYRKMSPERVMRERLSDEDVQRLIEHCIDSGHLSTMEHGIIVVGFEGFSRSFLAQLSRHRHLGMDIQSQDYVDHSTARICSPSKLQAIMDKSPENDPQLGQDMMLLSKLSQNVYRRLLVQGVEKDQAREKLLTEVEVRGVVSANPRAWFEFITKRACDLNGEQIFEFALMALKICRQLAPTIFKNAGPGCIRGKCPEGDRCCGEPWNKLIWVWSYSAKNVGVDVKDLTGKTRYEGTVDEEWQMTRSNALKYGLTEQAPRTHA